MPGPATAFPIVFESERSAETVVGSLEDVRSGSWTGGFFREMLPVNKTCVVHVAGFSVSAEGFSPGRYQDGNADFAEGTCDSRERSGELDASLARFSGSITRAVYCLGLDRAIVKVGLGDGGPWVLDVAANLRAEERSDGSIASFLGAGVEYLMVNAVTGVPEHKFHEVFVPRGSPSSKHSALGALGCRNNDRCSSLETLSANEAGGGAYRRSSPMPFPEMPLATRLRFRGQPRVGLLRLLDRTVAVLGMLVSPVGEARERHATAEGLLGAVRLAGEGFEYESVPSLLWNETALYGLVAVTKALCDEWNRSTLANGPAFPASAPQEQDVRSLKVGSSDGAALAKGNPEEEYRFQRAYYHCDKRFFASAVADMDARFERLPLAEDERKDVRALLEMAARAASGDPEGSPGSDPEKPRVERCGNATAAGLLSALRAGFGQEDDYTDPAVDVDGCRPGEPGLVLGIMSPHQGGARRFGIETDRFKELIKTAAAQGVLAYVFFPNEKPEEAPIGSAGVAANSTIPGWLYRDKRGWFQAGVPAPDVVYDRHIQSVAAGSATKDAARRFQESQPGIQFVNSLELAQACKDKFYAHRILSSDPYLADCLPETILADDLGTVAGFVAARKRTFLKPRGGTGSRGIIVVDNLGNGSFAVSGWNAGTVLPFRSELSGNGELLLDRYGLADALSALLGLCRAESGNNLSGCPAAGAALLPHAGHVLPYIAQRGIDLARLPGQGEVFEVRVICQKGGMGTWLRTGMVCRINPSRGRFIVPGEELHVRIDDLLTGAFPKAKVHRIKDTIRELARRIPRALEAASGRGGEVSIDIGIDVSGHPYVIEVNSKPASLFRDIGAFELRLLSLRRIVNYALSLGGKADK